MDNPTEEITRIETELKTATHAMREYIEDGKKESQKRGEETAETKQAMDRAEEDVHKLGKSVEELVAQVKASNDRIDQFEMSVKESPEIPLEPEELQYQKNQAFRAAIKLYTGDAFTSQAARTLTKEEVAAFEVRPWTKGNVHVDGMPTPPIGSKAAQIVSDQTLGGYLAPNEFRREMLKDLVEFNPYREVCRVMGTSFRSIEIPKQASTNAAAWVQESATRATTGNLTFSIQEVPTHEMYCMIDISQQMLEDSIFDIEALVRQDCVEKFATLEETGFGTGTSVGQPEGFTTNSDVTAVNTGHATNVTADGLIDLYFGLKTNYARKGVFLLNRTTLKAIRKLVDSNNQYLWEPGLAGRYPQTIISAPFKETPSMADLAASSKSIAFGDFKRAYLILDKLDFWLLRDPYTQAASGNVRLFVRKRVGGQVILPEAIVLQNTSA